MQRFAFATVIGLLGVSLLSSSVIGTSEPSLASRVKELEKRVEELETWKEIATGALFGAGPKVPSASNAEDDSTQSASSLREFPVRVPSKYFQPSNPSKRLYQDHIIMDVEVTPPSALKKRTKSVKGVLEFADLFGEVYFRVRWTIDEPLRPGTPLRENGLAIEYNQFLDTHQWLRARTTEDMKVTFTVDQILYEDGTIEKVSAQ